MKMACIGLAVALFSTSIAADSKLAVTLHAGVTEAIRSDYTSNAPTQGLNLGVINGNWLTRLGYSDLGDARQDGNNEMLRVDIVGAHIDTQYRVVDAFLDFYLGGGVYYHQLESRFYGYTLSETEEFNPYINLLLSRDIVSFFALQLETKYLWDVGGSDMIGLGINAQFKF